jgi:transcriptional regulator with XRE-family HTH domain
VSINQRIKNIRRSLGLNQTQMAEALALKQGSYSTLESGKSGLSFSVRKILIDTLNVNESYIDDGVEPIFNNKPKESLSELQSENNTLKRKVEELEHLLSQWKEVAMAKQIKNK